MTTSADTIDPTDGQLSLREAVAQANATFGVTDTVTFSESLLGGTLLLEQGPIEVTDNLVIDGDAADRGAGGVVLAAAAIKSLDGPIDASGIRTIGADLRLEDLTLTQCGSRDRTDTVTGLEGIGADVNLLRVAVTGLVGHDDATGVRTEGGSLLARSVEISGVGSSYSAQGIDAYGTAVRVVDSRISDVIGDYTYGIDADGPLQVVDTLVRGVSGLTYATGISAGGNAMVIGTTIADVNASFDGRGLEAFSALTLVNSTVSGVYGFAYGVGVLIGGTSQSTITSTTIAGNEVGDARTGNAGLRVLDGANLRLENSIVAGNQFHIGDGFVPSDVLGTVDSNGHNIFGQNDVAAAVTGDLVNVSVGALFAALDAEGVPVLADNGGPAPTLALRDGFGNPALAGADPTDSPATDQRGEARPQPEGTAPDIGAFELNQTAVAYNEITGTHRGEFLSGTSDADLMRGLRGDDRLWGRPGDDLLFGNAGRDVLAGKAGVDQMTGGAEADRFLYRRPTDAPPDGPVLDQVMDFRRGQHDQIDLRPIDANQSVSGNQKFSYIGEQAFTGAGQLRYEQVADLQFLVSGSTDRHSAPEFAFLVHSGVEQLQASDFLL